MIAPFPICMITQTFNQRITLIVKLKLTRYLTFIQSQIKDRVKKAKHPSLRFDLCSERPPETK
jgi:hypothetical protein